MSDPISVSELFFFDAKPAALPVYEALREAILERIPDIRIEVKKTQISFFNRHMFAAVSFMPVRKAKNRPDPFITITFGLSYRKESSLIDASTEPYPNRWTHHVMIGAKDEIDDELLSWIIEAAEFAGRQQTVCGNAQSADVHSKMRTGAISAGKLRKR